MYPICIIGHKDGQFFTTSNEALFRLFCDYHMGQAEENCFVIQCKRTWNGRRTKEGKRLVLRAVAQEWQSDFERFNYSYLELAAWTDFFCEYGKKYGLLREFRENGII